MFTDPLAVTYNGTGYSLPRVSVAKNRARYVTADGELAVVTASYPNLREGKFVVGCTLSRRLPDPTPANVFDDYRQIINSFGVQIGFDLTRAEASVDIPRLRTALLALVDTTFQGRLIAGEK